MLEIDGSRYSGSGTIVRQASALHALADGESRLRIPVVTEHVLASAWLAREFLGADVAVTDNVVTVRGIGFQKEVAHARQPPLPELRVEAPS